MVAVHSIVRGTAAHAEGPRTLQGGPQDLDVLDLAETHPPNPRL